MKVGLIGIGFMGRGHLDQYIRLGEEGSSIKLTAIADTDRDKFKGKFLPGNLNIGMRQYDFSRYHCYECIEEMIRREELDAVDIVLPTDLHAQYAIMAMEAGLHVLCEKPMAVDLAQCDEMIAASQRTRRHLMIAQVLRFTKPYEILKGYVDSGEFGKPVSFSLFRGGPTPNWSYQEWSLDRRRSGGCLLDQHIHDVDALVWMFGCPQAVSCVGYNMHSGAGYDAVSTHYRYGGFIAHAADDWAMNGKDIAFGMYYRANFEKGTIIYENGITTVYPQNAEKFIAARDEDSDNGYYREIKYFADVIAGQENKRASLQSVRTSIAVAGAEERSADRKGEWITL